MDTMLFNVFESGNKETYDVMLEVKRGNDNLHSQFFKHFNRSNFELMIIDFKEKYKGVFSIVVNYHVGSIEELFNLTE